MGGVCGGMGGLRYLVPNISQFYVSATHKTPRIGNPTRYVHKLGKNVRVG